jgi:hypothetical protein
VRGPRTGVPCRVISLLDISLSHSDAWIGPLTVAYDTVFGGALALVGVGVSFLVLPKARR